MKFLFEKVYIETPVDTDGDGRLDLIAAYIRRPDSTLSGIKVPAVFVADPYMMTCNEDWYKPYDVDQELKVYPQQHITAEDVAFDFDAPVAVEPSVKRITAGFAETAETSENVEFECISKLYAHLNDRGYASVFAGGLGTLGSEGFTLSGSREEILAFKAVIDWLNGRARAFTNLTDNIEIKASWCTGSVAMSAKSYLGTMCIGVAATGVEGLKTIIPEAGICNWYTYYRQNGLCVPAMGWQGDDIDILAKYCFSRAKDPDDFAAVGDAYFAELAKMSYAQDRESGNYSRFWDERNYLDQVDNIKCSVFIIHGINDWNVKTNQCFDLFEALQKRDIPRKILAHQGEHIYVYDLKGAGVTDMIDRWLDHYLKGEDNGADREPKVLIESNLDQKLWQTSDVWPPEEARMVRFPVGSGSFDGGMVTFTDDITKTVYDKSKDNLSEWRDELVLSKFSSSCVRFVWDVFDNDEAGDEIRISGRTRVSFRASIDRKTAILSAALVDLGDAKRLTPEPVPNVDEPYEFRMEAEPSQYKIISRGWMNAQNRSSIWSKDDITPGEFYDYSLEMIPTDHTIRRGSKLALIIYGTDAEETLRPKTVTNVTIDTASIDCEVPMKF